MAKQHVSAAGRGLPGHPAVFLAITPEIRRALELLAEASITLLDEIDAPVDGLEEDPDFEVLNEDDEPNHGWSADGCVFGPDDDREPNLGWTNDGDTSGEDADEDLVAAETSGGFPARLTSAFATLAEAKASFDPRLAARPAPPPREWVEHQNGVRFAPSSWTMPAIPSFPYDRPDRPACHIEAEIRRLNKALMPVVAKKRRQRKVR